MVEAASALDDLDAILTVPGLDGVYVGSGDLSLSLNLAGANRRGELHGVLSSIIARAGAAGVPVGVHAYNGEDAAGYAAEGATIVTVAVDAVSLREARRTTSTSPVAGSGRTRPKRPAAKQLAPAPRFRFRCRTDSTRGGIGAGRRFSLVVLFRGLHCPVAPA